MENAEHQIFIVYANNDVEFADALKRLFEYWGFRAFYCRQEHRDQAVAKPYRDDLRDELKRSALVVLLLSREFQHSQYCQVEAGMTVVLEKPFILVMIPPATKKDIKEISPILEGMEILDGSDPRRDFGPRNDFISLLKTRLSDRFGALPERPQTVEGVHPVRLVQETLARLIDEYRLKPPRQVLMWVWPSLKRDSPAASVSLAA